MSTNKQSQAPKRQKSKTKNDQKRRQPQVAQVVEVIRPKTLRNMTAPLVVPRPVARAKDGAMFRSTVMSQQGPRATNGNPIKDYLKCLVKPFEVMARIPDAFDERTALLSTHSSFSIPIVQDNINSGRFSFALQPIIGDLSQPAHYQAAVANGPAITAAGYSDWTSVDWSQASSYLSTSSLLRDPRTDLNASFLTNPPPFLFGTTFGTTVADLSASTLLSAVKANQTPFADNTSPDLSYLISSPAAPRPNQPNTIGVITLPYGDWNIDVFCKFQVSTIPGAGFAAINFGGVGNNTQCAAVYQPQTAVSSTGTTYNAFANFQITSYPANHNTFFPCLAALQTGTTGTNTYLPNSTVSSVTIVITPCNFKSTNLYSDGGVIQEIRPVAMACLVSYMGTRLNDGGEIAIARVPSKLLQNNFFQTNNAGVGQLQLIENLRNLDTYYDDRLEYGAYCYWTPYDYSDIAFYPVSDSNAHGYPALVCSGYFSPDATVNSTQQTLRVECYFVYEYLTQYSINEKKATPGAQASVDCAWSVLKGVNPACANGKHLDRIKSILQGAAQFYKNNASWIVPGATALAGLL